MDGGGYLSHQSFVGSLSEKELDNIEEEAVLVLYVASRDALPSNSHSKPPESSTKAYFSYYYWKFI